MLKMVIADDEALVRNSLETLLDWESYGIKIVASASNGNEAFEFCEKLKPDILLTDIKMPFMDGLEVATKLKEENFQTKIIIISGIQDFNYAKTALEIRVEDYILKPIKIKELHQVIKKIITNIDKEKNKELYISNLKKQSKENLFLAREKFLINFIMGSTKNTLHLEERLKYLAIPFEPNENLQVCVFEIDHYDTLVLSEEDYQLLIFSIDNSINDIIINYEAGMTFTVAENRFVIIFNEMIQTNEKHNQICQEILDFVNQFLDVKISMGIGIPVSGILQLNTSYLSALKALKYKFYTGSNTINNITDFELNHNPTAYPQHIDWFSLQDELFNNIQLGNEALVTKIIDEIFDLICNSKLESIEYVQNTCFEILTMISRKLFEMNEKLENITNINYGVMDFIAKQKTIFALKSSVSSVCITITTYFSNKHNQKNLKVVQSIKNYIDSNYMNNISVSGIAEEIYLTPNYISSIFKYATNMTIIEYLTRVRMTKAKELLKSPDLKVLEISEMIGYPNPRYFSKIFKKMTGLHPSQFRDIL